MSNIHFSLSYKANPTEKAVLVLSENNIERIIPLQYSAQDCWVAIVNLPDSAVTYHYEIWDKEDNMLRQEYRRRKIDFPTGHNEIPVQDYWMLLAQPTLMAQSKMNLDKETAAEFEKSEIQAEDQVVFQLHLPVFHPAAWVEVLGNEEALGQWQSGQGLKMKQIDESLWQMVFSPAGSFIEYKYVLHQPAEATSILWEEGPNRRISVENRSRKTLFWVNDFAFRWPTAQLPKRAGVAVPVFSLRSKESLGIGEFPDLKLLGDWAEKSDLQLIQLLPVNDTTAQYNWWDSYPYAAISVHALNPMYISPLSISYALSSEEKNFFQKEQSAMEAEKIVDFPQVQRVKWTLFRQIFSRKNKEILQNPELFQFLKENEYWLKPYAAFCFLRDKYGTADFHQWKTHNRFQPKEIDAFFQPQNSFYQDVLFYAWLQYEAHLQLVDAVGNLHSRGIALKGDLPIGIYRNSVEAWSEPEYFNLNFQAGAPPDFYSEEGQNWGFPTYRWEAMAADGYQWWQNRLHSLEKYFDALRIDHILGFFRIWSIPTTATSAALGYFRPAQPYSEEELEAAGIAPEWAVEWAIPQFSQSYLEKIFGQETKEIIHQFFESDKQDQFVFKQKFSTQRKCADFFSQNPESYADALIHLHTEVLFITEHFETSIGYHLRIEGASTDRFAALNPTQQQIYQGLLTDYFTVRQEKMWREAALEKLSALLPHTRMLICAEDLGFQPTTVKEVMMELGLLGLKVLQIPEGTDPYLPPGSVDYYNVITTSTHDNESLRGWWESHLEARTALFRECLMQHGTPPGPLHPYLAEKTIQAFLEAPAMLAILPLQDWMAMDSSLNLLPAEEERINNPAMIPNKWQYRMPLTLEKLNENAGLIAKIKKLINRSSRCTGFYY